MDKHDAKQLVQKYIAQYDNEELCLMIIDSETIEFNFGWVFFYTSKMYLETGNNIYAIVGNAPIIVDKEDGSLHITGTAAPVEEYIKKYIESKKNNRPFTHL